MPEIPRPKGDHPRVCLSRGRRSLLMPVVSALIVLFAHPSSAAAPVAGSDGPTVSAQVARLYEEAASVTEAYEKGRRAADAQRARARLLQEQLAEKRREVVVLHDRVGEVARAQYRTGGSLAVTARMLLASDPEDVLRAERVVRQADQAVDRLMEHTGRAERRLASAESRAEAAWRDLDVRQRRLAAVKRDLEVRLEQARWRLQAEADRSVAAGSCPGAARLEQPDDEPADGKAWLAPLSEADDYALSAGFDAAGKHWAHRHTGQDFAVAIGTPVQSIGAGRVESVSCGGGFGIEVVVRHADGWYSQYAHLASAAVDQGEAVAAGQWIGQAGTTGNSTGPHLHFEVRVTPHLGSGVDPLRWLREHGVEMRGESQ